MPDTGHLNSLIPHALNSELLVIYFVYLFFFPGSAFSANSSQPLGEMHVCMYVCIGMYVRRYIRTYLRMYVCMYVCTCKCVHVCVRVRVT